jgi:hypothetical protein
MSSSSIRVTVHGTVLNGSALMASMEIGSHLQPFTVKHQWDWASDAEQHKTRASQALKYRRPTYRRPQKPKAWTTDFRASLGDFFSNGAYRGRTAGVLVPVFQTWTSLGPNVRHSRRFLCWIAAYEGVWGLRALVYDLSYSRVLNC